MINRVGQVAVPPAWNASAPSPVVLAAGVGVGVLLLSLLGIFTRPGSDLAAFWPANAFMLGMMVRFPRTAVPATWVFCALGYLAADVIAGSPLSRNLLLNSSNLLAVAAGYVVLRALPEDDRRLRNPNSILRLLVATCFAALLPAVIGAMADPMLFDGSSFSGFMYWGATELVNMIAFLPMLLTIPSRSVVRSGRWVVGERRRRVSWRRHAWRVAPVVALVLSGAGSLLVGGPGAVAFPVPMLLWCAATYPMFVTACLCFCYVVWSLLAIASGLIPVVGDFDSRPVLLSTRVGVALVALAPLAVASLVVARNDLVARLRHLAYHDPLTGMPNRAAFFERAAGALAAAPAGSASVAMMMLDIDHFKAVNDAYGHRAGDEVLRHFSHLLADCVREGDCAARLGGEEFAILLPQCDAAVAQAIALRITATFAATPTRLADGRDVPATVSIGIAVARTPCAIDTLLGDADAALYRAKAGGRNRVEFLATVGRPSSEAVQAP